MIKDYLGNEVNVGNEVILLYKQRAFKGIDKAYLVNATYKGKGQYGYEFMCKLKYSQIPVLIRIKEPECIKLNSEVLK